MKPKSTDNSHTKAKTRRKPNTTNKSHSKQLPTPRRSHKTQTHPTTRRPRPQATKITNTMSRHVAHRWRDALLDNEVGQRHSFDCVVQLRCILPLPEGGEQSRKLAPRTGLGSSFRGSGNFVGLKNYQYDVEVHLRLTFASTWPYSQYFELRLWLYRLQYCRSCCKLVICSRPCEAAYDYHAP